MKKPARMFLQAFSFSFAIFFWRMSGYLINLLAGNAGG
jgi:hypothetical protein